MRTRRSYVPIGLLLLVAALWPGAAESTTWRVEKDGTGDFTVIQEAVDAAASGDTILIGPGRYEEYSEYQNPATLWYICVLVHDLPELTLIGAGREATIIALEEGFDPGWATAGLAAWPNQRIRIESIGIGSFYRGIDVSGGDVQVRDCSLACEEGCDAAVWPQSAGDIVISECRFDGPWSEGVLVLGSGSADLLIEGCWFAGCDYGVAAQSLANPSVRVIGCEFVDGVRVGISYSDGTGGEIRGNSVRGNSWAGISLIESGNVAVTDNYVEISGGAPRGIAFWLESHAGYLVTCTGNVFRSDQRCVYVPYPRDFSVHGNHFLPLGDGVAVSTYIPGTTFPHDYPEPVHLDFTLNYWGTTDVEEIAAMIVDYHDYPEHEVVVDFEPMADGPVATEERSWSDIKALYR